MKKKREWKAWAIVSKGNVIEAINISPKPGTRGYWLLNSRRKDGKLVKVKLTEVTG